MGPAARSILAVLKFQPMAARDLAGLIREPLPAVVKQLSYLVATGRVRVACRRSMPPAKRPVAVYGLPETLPTQLFAARAAM